MELCYRRGACLDAEGNFRSVTSALASSLRADGIHLGGVNLLAWVAPEEADCLAMHIRGAADGAEQRLHVRLQVPGGVAQLVDLNLHSGGVGGDGSPLVHLEFATETS